MRWPFAESLDSLLVRLALGSEGCGVFPVGLMRRSGEAQACQRPVCFLFVVAADFIRLGESCQHS